MVQWENTGGQDNDDIFYGMLCNLWLSCGSRGAFVPEGIHEGCRYGGAVEVYEGVVKEF